MEESRYPRVFTADKTRFTFTGGCDKGTMTAFAFFGVRLTGLCDVKYVIPGLAATLIYRAVGVLRARGRLKKTLNE